MTANTPERSFLFKLFSSLTAFVFLFTSVFLSAPAQAANLLSDQLPVPGSMLQPSSAYTPALVRGMTVNLDDPFQFDFVIHPGDSKLEGIGFVAESQKLIKYFLAALTVPEDDLWVNLSPYEKDRVIPQHLGHTRMGYEMLAQDYILKQFTASLMYPEGETGKAFWTEVYEKAAEMGITDVPMDTFNKVWIVPNEVEVYEHRNHAFIVKNTLKVMLEEDYVARDAAVIDQVSENVENREYMKQIAREVVIPVIEREVNEGRHFASLRQIYSSMLLAAWYKKRLKQSVLGQLYADQNKVSGIDTVADHETEAVWERYVEAFKKGAYNYIGEDYDPATATVVSKKYFSGGLNFGQLVKQPRLGVNILPLTFENSLDGSQEVRFQVGPFQGGGGVSAAMLAGVMSQSDEDGWSVRIVKTGGMFGDPVEEISVGKEVTSNPTNSKTEHTEWVTRPGFPAIPFNQDIPEDFENWDYEKAEALYPEVFINNIVARLQTEQMLGKMDGVYGMSYEEATKLKDSNRFADIGMDHDDKANRLGWMFQTLDWLLKKDQGKQALEAFLDKVDGIKNNEKKINNFLILGMGGSRFAADVVISWFLPESQDALKVSALGTNDPKGFDQLMAKLLGGMDKLKELGKSLDSVDDQVRQRAKYNLLVVFTSLMVAGITKSATTAEVHTMLDYMKNFLKDLNLDPKEMMQIITDPNSKYFSDDEQGQELQKNYPIVDFIQLNQQWDIGGRFTAPTTLVFLLALALLTDRKTFMEVLNRAWEMNKGLQDENERYKHQAVRFGAKLYYYAEEYPKEHNGLKKDKLTFITPEGEAWDRLIGWEAQLWEESDNEKGKGVMVFHREPLTVNNLRPVEKDDRVYAILKVKGEKLSQENQELVNYLVANGYPHEIFELESSMDIGGFMMGQQYSVATLGYLLNVNFVMQKGVQLYKKAIKALMAKFKESGSTSLRQPQEWEKKTYTFNGVRFSTYPLIKAGRLDEKKLERKVREEFKSDMTNGAAVFAAVYELLKDDPTFEFADIAVYGVFGQEFRQMLVNEFARPLFTDQGLPFKLDNGPDRNHSTEHGRAEGPNTYVSFYFLSDTSDPQTTIFGDLNDNELKAAAIGTIQTRYENGNNRRGLLFLLDKPIEESMGDLKGFFSAVRGFLELENTNAAMLTGGTQTLEEWIGKNAKNIWSNDLESSLTEELNSELIIDTMNNWLITHKGTLSDLKTAFFLSGEKPVGYLIGSNEQYTLMMHFVPEQQKIFYYDARIKPVFLAFLTDGFQVEENQMSPNHVEFYNSGKISITNNGSSAGVLFQLIRTGSATSKEKSEAMLAVSTPLIIGVGLSALAAFGSPAFLWAVVLAYVPLLPTLKNALLPSFVQEARYGGIDFKASGVDMSIRVSDDGFVFPQVDAAMLDNFRVNGLEMNIIKISPLGMPVIRQMLGRVPESPGRANANADYQPPDKAVREEIVGIL